MNLTALFGPNSGSIRTPHIQENFIEQRSLLPAASLYNDCVARGWESKSVESQIESAGQQTPSEPHSRMKTQNQELDRQRELLQLSRANVQRQLDTVENPRYRDQLNKALADLDAKLAKLPSAE
jgi:hypothetical protein